MLLFAVLSCSTPSCPDTVTGPEPLRTVAADARAAFRQGTGLDLCFGEVEASEAASLKRRKATLRADHAYADVFYLGCLALDAEQGITADGVDRFSPAGLPPEFDGEDARTEAFARACARIAEQPLPLLDVFHASCGQVSPLSDDDQLLVDLLGSTTLLPRNPHQFEELGQLQVPPDTRDWNLVFADDLLVVVEEHDDTVTLRAFALPSLAPLWTETLEAPAGERLYLQPSTSLHGVTLSDATSGRVWSATTAGLEPLAPATPYALRTVFEDAEGWFVVEEVVQQQSLYRYDPVLGRGERLVEGFDNTRFDAAGSWVDHDGWRRIVSEEPLVGFFAWELQWQGVAGGKLYARAVAGSSFAWVSRPAEGWHPWTLETHSCNGWHSFAFTNTYLFAFDLDRDTGSVIVHRLTPDAPSASSPTP